MANLLHVYSPAAHHCEAFIVGDREGIEKLLQAVQAALATGAGVSDTFTADGEGFFVCVRVTDGAEMERIALPYVDDYAQDKHNPWPKYGECKRLIEGYYAQK